MFCSVQKLLITNITLEIHKSLEVNNEKLYVQLDNFYKYGTYVKYVL
jgi:hypothetical protein